MWRDDIRVDILAPCWSVCRGDLAVQRYPPYLCPLLRFPFVTKLSTPTPYLYPLLRFPFVTKLSTPTPYLYPLLRFPFVTKLSTPTPYLYPLLRFPFVTKLSTPKFRLEVKPSFVFRHWPLSVTFPFCDQVVYPYPLPLPSVTFPFCDQAVHVTPTPYLYPLSHYPFVTKVSIHTSTFCHISLLRPSRPPLPSIIFPIHGQGGVL